MPTLALFLRLPALNGTQVEPLSAITVEFVQLTPRAPLTPPAPRPEPKPRPRPKPKPEPKPVPKPTTAPEPPLERSLEPRQPPVPEEPAAVPEDAAVREGLPHPVPRFLHRQLPEYPPAMRDQGREGSVKLAVLIDDPGRVRQVTVIQSAGDEFDRAATRALQSSTFVPGLVEGKQVPVLLHLPVNFKLR